MAERKNNQVPVDIVINLKNQGYSNTQIIDSLKKQNYSLQEISDAMNQSDIKNTIDSPDIDLSNAPSPSGINNEDFPNPPMPSNDDYANMNPYQDLSANTGMGTNYSNQGYGNMPQRDSYTEKIEEIAESIIKEKWDDMLKEFGDVNIWKEKTRTDILSIKQELLRTQERFENLQRAILGKVTEYDKDVKDIGTEIKALEKVLEKIIDPLTSNIKDLQRVTDELKYKRHKGKK